MKSEEEGSAEKEGEIDVSEEVEEGREASGLSCAKGCAKSVRARRSAVTQKFPTQMSVVPTLMSCTHAVKLEPGYNSLDSADANLSRSVRFHARDVFMISMMLGSIPAHGTAYHYDSASLPHIERRAKGCKWQAYQATRHEEHLIKSQDTKSIQ